MKNITIRLTNEQDLIILNQLDHVAKGEPARRSFIKDATGDNRAWIIEASNKKSDKISNMVIGYGVISHAFFGKSFIELIYIDKCQRGEGYGPKLISFLEKQSQSKDIFTSTNASNSHMQHVLESLGYERSGIIDNLDPDDPEIIYVKKQQSIKNNAEELKI